MEEQLWGLIGPQFAALVAALYCLGAALKHAERVPNRLIPLILTGCGVVLAALSVFGRLSEYGNPASALFEAAVQGTLCAGMAVYVNQLAKQARADK